jgi:hypothetical protein
MRRLDAMARSEDGQDAMRTKSASSDDVPEEAPKLDKADFTTTSDTLRPGWR